MNMPRLHDKRIFESSILKTLVENVLTRKIVVKHFPHTTNQQQINLKASTRPTFFPTFNKSQCDKRRSSFTNGLSIYVEKQPVAWKECCVKYRCEKARKHMNR